MSRNQPYRDSPRPGYPCCPLWWVVALAVLLPGCVFRELGENLERVDSAAQVSFTVEGERFGDHPVIAALVRDDEAVVTVETYGEVPPTNTLTLRCPPGEYLLVAFQDINGNTRYDHGEPFAKYGDPTPIDFWAQRDIEGLKLTLSLPVDPDAWSPTRLRERGVEVSERLSDFGQVVTLDDPRFERDIARMGMWEPARFIEENHAGLYTLEEYNPQKIPVVFVHGIGGSPRHFETIIAQMDRSRFQPWLFYYPSGLRVEEDLGEYLHIAIGRMHFGHQPDRVFVVAHSMGGLVAWAGVRAHLRDVPNPYLELLVTINSPLGGMESAAAGVDYAPVVMRSWYALDPRSEFLKRVYREPLPDRLPYHLFYGVAESPAFELPVQLETLLQKGLIYEGDEASDETVAIESQLHRPAAARALEIHGYRATHMGILQDAQAIAQLNRILAEAADQPAASTDTAP